MQKIKKTKKHGSGIYLIEAVLGSRIGWLYVGQSVGGHRGYDHFRELKLGIHYNSKLQRYYNKYGENSLKWRMFFNCSKDELNFWEKWWIKSFDSKNNGFNMTWGGENPPEHYKECILTNIWTKETVTCPSIKEFSEKYNLCRVGISQVLLGKSNYVDGWYSMKNSWRPKYCKVISPEDIEYEIANIGLQDFCLKHGIKNHGNFRSMFNGDQSTCEGWVRSDRIEAKNSQKFKKSFKLINPNGEICDGIFVLDFAKKFNLSAAQLYKVVSGEIFHYRGWRLYRDGVELTKFNFEEHKINKKPKSKTVYKFVSPQGIIFETNNLTKFAKEHGLSAPHLCYIWKETKWMKSCKGWVKYKEGQDPELLLKKQYKFLSPNNDIYITNNITKFAKEHNLGRSSVGRLVNGKINTFKGWSIHKEN